MTRTSDTPVFHLFRCPYCESTHYEHERSARSFARYAAKHLSRCGKPQQLRHITEDDALDRIVTREVGTLVVPEDWTPPAVSRARANRLAAQFGMKVTAG